MNVNVFIDRGGSVRFVYDDGVMEALRDLGPASTVRASHVEPTADGKHWTADMSPVAGAPVELGPFPTRQAALDAEAEWLARFLAGGVGRLTEFATDTTDGAHHDP